MEPSSFVGIRRKVSFKVSFLVKVYCGAHSRGCGCIVRGLIVYLERCFD